MVDHEMSKRAASARQKLCCSFVRGFLQASVALPGAKVAPDFEQEQLLASGGAEGADGFVDRDKAYAILERRLAGCEQDGLGLKLGGLFPTCANGPVMMLMAQAATAREGYHWLCQYSPLLTNELGVSMVQEGRQVTIYMAGNETDAPCRAKLVEEASLMSALRYLLMFCPGVEPSHVSLVQPAPREKLLYGRYLGRHLEFGQEITSLTVSAQVLDHRALHHDPELEQVLHALTQRRLLQLTAARPVMERARECLLRSNTPHRVQIGVVAEALQMSPRSLQRRLADEGTVFSTLSHEAAAAVATRLIGDEWKSVKEASYLMGFGDTNSFYRAFKRWTGTTPSLLRAERIRRMT